MISEKQLAANRRNAQLSTGARTPAGHARSSLNNLRHGLTVAGRIAQSGKPAANDRKIRVSHRETPAFEPHHCAGKGK